MAELKTNYKTPFIHESSFMSLIDAYSRDEAYETIRRGAKCGANLAEIARSGKEAL